MRLSTLVAVDRVPAVGVPGGGSFFCSQEVTGKDKALEQLNAKLAQAERPVCRWKKLGKLNLEDQMSQLARRPSPRRRASATASRASMTGWPGAGDAQGPRQRAQQGALDSEKSR